MQNSPFFSLAVAVTTVSTQSVYPGRYCPDLVGLGGWLQSEMVYLSDGSSIPLLLGFNVERLRYMRPTRYYYAKPLRRS